MEREILSLKSIYKILTANDYPVYSGKVISKEHHKGLSLIQFWQNMLISEWKETITGVKIWRSEGGRNRYTSEVCNRSEQYHFYGQYIEEISGVFTSETLFQQIYRFMCLLENRDYNYKFLIYRIKAAIPLYEKQDPAFGTENGNFFWDVLREEFYFENQGSFGKLFFSSYLLTMLLLYALAGNGEGKASLYKMTHKVWNQVKRAYCDACVKEDVKKNWNLTDKQNEELQQKEMEWKAREYLGCLINCYEHLMDTQKAGILKDTLIKLFPSEISTVVETTSEQNG